VTRRSYAFLLGAERVPAEADNKQKALQASIADLHSQTAQLEAQIAEIKAKLKYILSLTHVDFVCERDLNADMPKR
jgi:uncharacterized protein YceH (UPF0502 family)